MSVCVGPTTTTIVAIFAVTFVSWQTNSKAIQHSGPHSRNSERINIKIMKGGIKTIKEKYLNNNKYILLFDCCTLANFLFIF